MSEPRVTEAPTRRWPRWRSVLLVVSLALNLLVIGVVATAAVRYRLAPPPSVAQATVYSFARTLPDERRRTIWDATRAERQALRPYRIELRRARAEVRSALAAEPFDLARYRSAHDRLLEAEVQARRAAHVLLEKVATRLTPDERRAFARWQPLAERPWRGRFGWRGPPPEAGEDELPAAGPGPDPPRR